MPSDTPKPGELSAAWKTMLADTMAGLATKETEILNLAASHQTAVELERNLRANHRYSPELLLSELKQLKQLIAICAYCHKIDTAEDYWQRFET